MKGRAYVYTKSYYENGRLVTEGAGYVEGNSSAELQAAAYLANGLAKGQGIVHGLEKAAKVLPASQPNIEKLLE